MIKNIFDYITAEESSYKTRPIPVADGYEWHMPEHIRICTLYKDGRLLTGNSDDKPVKNIMLPILNVHYRSEGFDVKDIEPYVDSDEHYYKSFLVKKYHDKFARENDIDTFIDDIVESYVDYGGTLVKKVKGARPEVIPLQKIAFCDQTDILSGPFAIKHQFSIDELKEKVGTWDKEAISEIIEQARAEKSVSQSNDEKGKTTGKYIEVYEVHGTFCKAWLNDNPEDYTEEEEDTYVPQIHLVSFAYDEMNQKYGITLYKGQEKPNLFKVKKRDKRFGTALGRSAIEELIEPQVWTNYNMIQIKKMLDKASLMLAMTSDTSFASKNNINDLESGEIMLHAKDEPVTPFIFPTVNLQQFENATIQWENHARTLGSANDAQLGVSPSSGTPFKLQELVVSEGRGMHEYRRGQIATFLEEIYRDWIIPDLISEMNDGQKFMSELSLDELQNVADAVTTNIVNNKVKEKILNNIDVTPEMVQAYKELVKQEFLKGGNKRFIEILKKEFDNTNLDVYVNVAGKQKNLNVMVDKLSNIFRQVFANPQILQDPNASKIFNMILEYSGISPLEFKRVEQPVVSPIQNQTTPAPTMQNVNNNL